jgi:hypothetical protein
MCPKSVLLSLKDFNVLPADAYRRLAEAGAFWTPPEASEQDIVHELETYEDGGQGTTQGGRERSYRRATAHAEAIVGCALLALGLDELRYEAEVAGKTPDWSRASEPRLLLDVFARTPGRNALFWLMDDSAIAFYEAVSDGDHRQVWSAVQEKVAKYSKAAEDMESPLFIAIVPLPLTSTSAELIATPPKGTGTTLPEYLFERHSHLGGVMVIEPVEAEVWKLTLWSNPNCSYPLPPQLVGC